MKDIRLLTKDRRVEDLILDTRFKYSLYSNHDYDENYISLEILTDFFRKIEDRIYYTSDFPTNDTKNYFTESISDFTDFVKITNQYKYIVFFNITPCSYESVLSGYNIRCEFIDDIELIRNDKLNKILQNEK